MKPTNYEAENFRWYITRPRMKALLTGMLRRIFAADSPVAVVATGTANLTDHVQAIDSSGGAVALAIPDGATATPQFLTLIASDVTAAITVTFTTVLGMATSVPMTTAGEIMVFYWDGLRWITVAGSGSGVGGSGVVYAASGAISPSAGTAFISAGGVLAMTLADGTFVGQTLAIEMVLATGDATVTIASAAGMIAAPIFGQIGDHAFLVWDGTNWHPLSLKLSADTTHALAGAVPITYSVVIGTTVGVEAWTLADGVEGQELIIQIVAHAGVPTITPATATYFATIAFAGVNDTARFRFTGGAWMCIGATGGVTVT